MEIDIPGISIVLTTKNEERNIGALLETLSLQEDAGAFEVVIVDSKSQDSTGEVVKRFSERIKLGYISVSCSRGEGRNIGVNASVYPYIVFTDGDTEWGSGTLKNYRLLFARGFTLVAGNVLPKGKSKFFMERVKLFMKGFEVTSPSANLGISRQLFLDIGGFDGSFITAEDIDLNIRAVLNGANFAQCKECIVYNRVRDSTSGFLKQAFWNGYGRYQLRRKHRTVWREIKKGQEIHNYGVYNILRLSSASLGYIYAVLRGGKFPRANTGRT